MKTNILNYVKAAVRLPFALVGGALTLAAVTLNTLGSLTLGRLSDANDYMDTIK
ncbi:MAG: hypothetical protein NC301_07580 [Bacteroides sp.]|nr:hypothetical protein [Bacteroides sp.]MCM1380057.1 hypothetical protein [Bacteroides sp.]MCM1446348.1 hypothetical protein [Prevotella sp.]